MISFSQQPAAAALFGSNPQWVEITTDGSDPNLSCELVFSVWNGSSFQETARLESPYHNQKAVFNISRLIELAYDLPSQNSIQTFEVTEASQLINRYQVRVNELLNGAANNETATFEARAINGRLGTIAALSAVFFKDGAPQLLGDKPLNRKIGREQQEWIYLFTQSSNISGTTLITTTYLSDGSTINNAIAINSTAQYDVHIIPIGFNQLNIGTAESGDLFVSRYEVNIQQSHAAGDFGLLLNLEIDYEGTSWAQPQLLFQTTKGGMEVLHFKGKTERTDKRQASQSKTVLTNTSTATTHLSITDLTTSSHTERLRSGWLDPAYYHWAKELLLIKRAWLIENDTFVPVRLLDVSMKQQDDQELYAFEVTIERTSN